jgi:hypothetical protein
MFRTKKDIIAEQKELDSMVEDVLDRYYEESEERKHCKDVLLREITKIHNKYDEKALERMNITVNF